MLSKSLLPSFYLFWSFFLTPPKVVSQVLHCDKRSIRLVHWLASLSVCLTVGLLEDASDEPNMKKVLHLGHSPKENQFLAMSLVITSLSVGK